MSLEGTPFSPNTSFTPRERQILSQLPGGATYHAIARSLGISIHTVDTYIRRLRTKTGATNRTQLAVLAVQLGYFAAPAPPVLRRDDGLWDSVDSGDPPSGPAPG